MAKAYLLLLLVPLLLHAKPLSVQQQQDGEQRHFRYQFSGADRDIRIQFTLPEARIRHNGNLVSVYVPAVVNQQLGRALQQQARQTGVLQLIAGPAGDWHNFRLVNSAPGASAPAAGQLNEQVSKQLLQLQHFSQQYQQRQLDGAGYHLLQLPDNRQIINVDHLKIIQQSQADINTLAANITPQLAADNPRQLTAILLAWVQQIPGHPAEQREYGRSFTAPLQLLAEHRGDSASKTVLLATLLRSSLPQLKQAILYLPEKTLLALALPASGDERTVTLQGNTYLLLDPADPQQQLGQVADPLLIYVLNQYFAYRLF